MLSLGLYNFGEINDIVSQFTPTSSPSLRERELADHFNLHNGAGKVVGTYVFVEAKDAGSLLRPPQLISLISLLLKSVVRFSRILLGKLLGEVVIKRPLYI